MWHRILNAAIKHDRTHLNGENRMNIITCNDKDLPDDLQAIANEAARITIAAIESAAAHMRDPAKFPMPVNAKLEIASLEVLKQRQAAKPRQINSLQLRSVANLSRVSAPTTTPASISLVRHLRAQPTLTGHGILAELKAMTPAVKALKLDTATSAAIKDAVATKNTEKLFDTIGLAFSIIPGTAAAAPTAALPTGFTKLILNIDRVKCLDDVGLELSDFLEDDIRLGGARRRLHGPAAQYSRIQSRRLQEGRG